MFEVISTNGDSHLGGDDFDNAIMKWLADEFKNDEGVDLMSDKMALQRLKEAAEKAKIELSSSSSTDINLPYITAVDGNPKHLVKTLTRAKFEQLSQGLLEKLHVLCKEALSKSKLDKEEISEVILVGGSTRIPSVVEVAREEFGKEPSKAVNPDEAVAVGASIQGAILNQEKGVGDIVLLDVTPLTLGIETMGGVMTKLIDANTTIPCHKSEVFSTAADNQTTVTVHVLQGERPMASQNKSLGRFNLEGILPARKGIPQIEVNFDIDANGILKVSAKDKATNKEQSIRIEASSNLSKEEIERMKTEAEANAESDKKLKEEAEAINKGDAIVFAQEQLMEEQKENLTEEDKSSLKSLIEEMKDGVKTRNVQKINETENAINSLWQHISERVYSKQGSTEKMSQEAPDAAADPSSDTNIQDAEGVEVN